MKRFFQFVKKETIQIVRDYRTMMIIVLMPVVLIVLFGFTISTEVNNVNIAIVSPSRQGETLRKLEHRLAANKYITISETHPASPNEADRLMKEGVIDMAIVVDKDLNRIVSGNDPTRTAFLLMADASNPMVSRMAVNYVETIITTEFSTQKTPVSLNIRMLHNPQMLSAYTFVPGILGLIILIICTLITSISIVREKESGTMDLLIVSPIRPFIVILAKLIPYLILSCINLATILILAKYVLDVPMNGSIFAICSISILYVLLSLAFGILISTFAANQIMAILISAVVMLIPVIMLSGLLFPIESLPKALQWLSCIVPARWYIEAMRKLMIEGASVASIMQQILILVGMTISIIVIAIKKFNKKM